MQRFKIRYLLSPFPLFSAFPKIVELQIYFETMKSDIFPKRCQIRGTQHRNIKDFGCIEKKHGDLGPML
jgi:hypothetical protein